MKGLSVALFAVFAAVLFLFPKESEAATVQHCPNGLCEPVLLCPPWTTWDETLQQCRTVRVCPGESQVLITGGECELYCGAGREPDPFKPHHCRTAFKCPPGRVEIEPNVCEISCPAGERQNPWRQGVCRRPVLCPGDLTEVSEGVCGCTGGSEPDPFKPHHCRTAFQCPPGRVEIEPNVCEIPCPIGERQNPWQQGACRHPVLCPGDLTEVSEGVCGCTGGKVAVENVCRCPSGAPFDRGGFCTAETEAAWQARLTREFGVSPASQIKGIERAISLGLSGAGVTIGVGEQGSPYWEDDCEINPDLSTFFPYIYLIPNNPAAVPLKRPNEEVPARFANYENGECDRGLVRTHSDFPSIRLAGLSRPSVSSRVADYNAGHVIAVIGVMAARKNGYGVAGVAPDADYAYAHSTYDWDALPGVEIVNYSIGPPAEQNLPITSYATLDENGATLTMATRENMMRNEIWGIPLSLTLRLEHVNTHAPADRRINVMAAGNRSFDELGVFSGMPLYFPELRGNNLAVVAIGGKGSGIASYSNRCGLAGASFCLAAPAWGFAVGPDIHAGMFRRVNGTSFSAPLVAGSLALMKEYFNRMGGIGNDELVRRLLATADKSGEYADESIYGAGVLDLENALTPQGELQLLSGRSVSDSESHSLSQSGLRTGPAFGDSIRHALRDVQVAAFDNLNAPFPVSAAGLIQSGSENESLREALSAMQHKKTSAPKTQWDFADGFGWWSLRGGNRAGKPEIKFVFGADNAYANPYSALAGDGMSGGLEWDSFRMEMFGESPGQGSRPRGAVGSFSFAPFSETMESGGWILHFGGVEEPNGFLSSSGTGAFGDLRSRTAFVGADYVGGDWDGWRVRLGGFAGETSAEDGGWFAGTESLRSDSFHLGVERENIFYSGDGLGFRLRQPLRASGSLKIRIPTGRTRYGDLTWREVSGKTSGRELSLEGLYRRSFDGGSWRISAGAVSEPGHRAEAKTIGRLLFAFEREF